MRLPARLLLAYGTIAAATALACGSRTALLSETEGPDDGDDASPFVRDAGADALLATDTSARPLVDSSLLPDSSVPIDASAFDSAPDARRNFCDDAGSSLIDVLTETALFAFDPSTFTFRSIGAVSCPSTSGPFSMAVDREGIAYSIFSDGELFRIDTATAACSPTTFAPNQDGFRTFGMGFVPNRSGAGETLFVAEQQSTLPRRASRGLATIDTAAFTLRLVGAFHPSIIGPELTGTPDGRLFGFRLNATGSGSHIAEIDPATGDLLSDVSLTVGDAQDAFAFAYDDGVFWIFTSSGGGSTVTGYDPATGTEKTIFGGGSAPGPIVGAGVSTCAPQ